MLVRVPTSAARPAARLELRAALREILAQWTRLPASDLPLQETPCGPAWQGRFEGRTLDISLSYAGTEGWIGLLRSGWVGVDVTRLEPMPDLAEVARHYLDPLVAEAVREAPDPGAAFAAAWTEREARVKCLKCELREWSPAQARIEAGCVIHKLTFENDLACPRLRSRIGAVAVAPFGGELTRHIHEFFTTETQSTRRQILRKHFLACWSIALLSETRARI